MFCWGISVDFAKKRHRRATPTKATTISSSVLVSPPFLASTLISDDLQAAKVGMERWDGLPQQKDQDPHLSAPGDAANWKERLQNMLGMRLILFGSWLEQSRNRSRNYATYETCALI